MKHTMTMAVVVAVLSGALFGGAAQAAPAKRNAKQVTGLINLNQASAAQLDLLPGVGAKAAARIIDFRKKTPFTRPEEIVQVKGFGKKKYDRLKAHLAVNGPTTLKVLEMLAASPEPAEQGRSAPAPRRSSP